MPEHILHDADAPRYVPQRLLGERYRQQVVGVSPGHPGPAHVIADPPRPGSYRQPAQPVQVAEVQRVGTADGQRDAVQDDGVPFGDLVEGVPGVAL